MATTIPCNVDTSPMAAEINSMSKHVMGTTAAVVTMQSAVIAAENRSADKVCSNVNRGFFTMIRSQISQKIASKHSRVEALIMHLTQQRRQLMGIKANMEREYGRISERYLKIFTSINKELESRIRQMDQPIFELVCKHMLTSSNRMNALASWASTVQSESLTDAQQILMSRMKYNAQIALEQTTEFLEHISEQRVLTEKVLISNRGGNSDACMQLPVIIYETVSNKAGMPSTSVCVSDAVPDLDTVSIQTAVMTDSDLLWSQEALPSYVTDEFNRLVETSNVKPRVKSLIQKMYSSTQTETI